MYMHIFLCVVTLRIRKRFKSVLTIRLMCKLHA